MERRGSGFKKILDDYSIQPQYTEKNAPVFFSEYDSFFLILSNLNYHEKHKGDRNCEINCDRKCDRAEKICDIMASEPQITIRAIAERLGLSKRQVEYVIAELKNSGSIRHEGSNKGGTWLVIK